MNRVEYVEVYRRLSASEAIELEEAGAERAEARVGKRAQSQLFSGTPIFRFPGAYRNLHLRASLPNLREEIQDQFHRYLVVPQVLARHARHRFEPDDPLLANFTFGLHMKFVHAPKYQGLDPRLDALVERIFHEPCRRVSVFWDAELSVLRFVLEPAEPLLFRRPVVDLHLFRDLRIAPVVKPVASAGSISTSKKVSA